MKHSNSRIFIFGGSSGLGLTTASKYLKCGADLAIFSRGESSGKNALVHLEAHRCNATQQLQWFKVDVADREDVLQSYAAAVNAIGEPDLVINLAGIGSLATHVDTSHQEFDRVLRTNLYGTRHVVEAALGPMLRRKQGHIVLVGSLGGFVPVYGYTSYGSSKFAVNGYAQCLRYELKPLGIDVSLFAPGEVDTPALANEQQHRITATTAMKWIGGVMPVDTAASALVKAIERRQFLIIPGLRCKAVYWGMRLTPISLWNRITDTIVSTALRRDGLQRVRGGL